MALLLENGCNFWHKNIKVLLYSVYLAEKYEFMNKNYRLLRKADILSTVPG
jgi:hypothetical protein